MKLRNNNSEKKITAQRFLTVLFWINFHFLILCLCGCHQSQAKALGPVAYSPLGLIKTTHHEYVTPGPTTIDLNLREIGFKSEKRPSGDRTSIGYGLLTVRND